MATGEDNSVCTYGPHPDLGERSTFTLRKLQVDAKGTTAWRNLYLKINQSYTRTQETKFIQLNNGEVFIGEHDVALNLKEDTERAIFGP